jgi:rhodanese-related sulfurtransferase
MARLYSDPLIRGAVHAPGPWASSLMDNVRGMAARSGERTSVEQLLAAARSELDRLTPADAAAAMRAGAVMVDIRPVEQRARDGELPGAQVISRNVLEWRLDPLCPHRDPDLAHPGRRVIVLCNEGYQSSLAAATLRRFGLDATDVIDGAQGWRAAGLPLTRAADH